MSEGSDAKIIGIDQAKEFRDIVLRQRDLLMDKNKTTLKSESQGSGFESDVNIFHEIRDTLSKIEEHLRPKT